MSVRTNLRQQPAQAVTTAPPPTPSPTEKEPTRVSTRARSSVALGELLTAGAERNRVLLVPLNRRRNAELRGDSGRRLSGTAGELLLGVSSTLDTNRQRTGGRLIQREMKCFPVLCLPPPTLCSPSVSASSAQVAACYRKICFQNKSEDYRLASN